MKTLTDMERDAINLAHSIPANTVIIIANVQGHRLYNVLRGTQIATVGDDAKTILGYHTHDGDENK